MFTPDASLFRDGYPLTSKNLRISASPSPCTHVRSDPRQAHPALRCGEERPQKGG